MITRTKVIVALVSALSILSLLGCGQSNHLQTIMLTSKGTSSGFINLKGEGGTIQLVATGNYSDSKTHDLSHVVTYTMTPIGFINDGFNPPVTPLLAPPQTGTISKTGLVTAVTPFVCTWHDAEPDVTQNKPVWLLYGSYQVIASFEGVVSQPIFIGVASAAGDGPSGGCGPS